ncbi:ATP-binding protein involved in chromosome partitioning [Raineyella antarctica]|uniref:Iron-sulfur cluster carrier protein n=2 Tax=Raineyella antarctica TaxID=1577474 RepID=A0A1G6GE04_9ACTN|nr:ATP-binding protein involved in chromosome partitioning [Raineyella antarctica]
MKAVVASLSRVMDPEIKRPLMELGMIPRIDIDADGVVTVEVLLTVQFCPLHTTITEDVQKAVSGIPGVAGAKVELGVMTDEQRKALNVQLRGGVEQHEIPFAKPGNLTRVLLVSSGKGGVGKSSVTANLALALARGGKKVGILDADIYGHSIPPMLGLAEAQPTMVGEYIMPVPYGDLKVMSIGMLKQSRDQVIAWRGPILDRALQQMLADVYWGDLDYLVVDLPPGTGDVAMSLGAKLPDAEVLVVTTPQAAAAEVAERAGTMADMLHQRVIGVVENMSYLEATCPKCGETHEVDIFGSGGGEQVSRTLSGRLGYDVPLLGRIPLDVTLRVAGDEGEPVVGSAEPGPSAAVIEQVAATLAAKPRGLAGMSLGVTPVQG